MVSTSLLQWQLKQMTGFKTGAGAPTVKLMGVRPESYIRPVYTAHRVRDLRGSLTPAADQRVVGQGVEAHIVQDLNLEDLNYYLEAWLGAATPIEASGLTFIRRYYAPGGTAPTPKPLQIMMGATGNLYAEAQGLVPTKIEISGRPGEMSRLTVDLVGWQFVNSDIGDGLAVLSDRAVNFVPGVLWQAWLNPTIDGFEDQALPTMDQFTVTIETGLSPRRYLGSALTPQALTQGRWDVKAKVTASGSESSIANIVNYGSFGTGGNDKLAFALYGISVVGGATYFIQMNTGLALASAPDLYKDGDGQAVVDLDLQGIYNENGDSVGLFFSTRTDQATL